MALAENGFGGIDLQATVKQLDARLTAVEAELAQAKNALEPKEESHEQPQG